MGRKNGPMGTEAVQSFSAILALAVLALGLVTLAAVLAPRAGWARGWRAQIDDSALWLMCAITTGAMVGSLWFSEHVGYAPCKLCWYQRIAMYSLAFLTFVAALRRDRGIAPYTIVLASLGLVVSTYHYLLEWWPQLETNVCSVDVPCTAVWFREYGFVTLCFMAGSAFIAVIALSVMIVRERTFVDHVPSTSNPTPEA